MYLPISFVFDYQGSQPNFKRDSFDTLAEMVSYNIIDDGHISYCKETGKHYSYKSSNETSPTLGKWRELSMSEVLALVGFSEVGDTADRDYAANTIVLHNDSVYKFNSIWSTGETWANADVTATSIVSELNALIGVSSESVYLTINPVTAIPDEGVVARVYNTSTSTYGEEVTFTNIQGENTQKLAEISFGDTYTIILPTIEGYTKPADLTFKAGQNIRSRTVEYIEAGQADVETITLKASTTDSVTIGDYSATVYVYDGGGEISQTLTISIEGGVAESFTLPIGTKYRVVVPAIDGYLTPKARVYTAVLSERVITFKYVAVVSEEYLLVTKDFEYHTFDEDLTEIFANDNIFGIAFVTPSLLSYNAGFIFSLTTDCNGTTVLSSNTSLGSGVWTSPIVDSPDSTSNYDGQTNTINVIQAIEQYEEENETTVTSIFKTLYDLTGATLEVNNVEYKAFIPARWQSNVVDSKASALTAIWNYYGKTLSISGLPGYGVWSSTQYNTEQAYMLNGAYNKDGTSPWGNAYRAAYPLIASPV